jgi:hypothetical protein
MMASRVLQLQALSDRFHRANRGSRVSAALPLSSREGRQMGRVSRTHRLSTTVQEALAGTRAAGETRRKHLFAGLR